jgi:hypothetical protein
MRGAISKKRGSQPRWPEKAEKYRGGIYALTKNVALHFTLNQDIHHLRELHEFRETDSRFTHTFGGLANREPAVCCVESKQVLAFLFC